METTEIQWRPVLGYPLYEVSSDGRVRNVASGKEKSTFIGNQGSSCVNLYRNGERALKQVHRLQGEAFLDLAKGLTINHKDGNRANNLLSNLEVVTQAENNLHKIKVLGKGRGETCWLSKLKDRDILEIRALRARGVTQTAIAGQFGIHQSVVSRICARKTWSHI